MPQDFLDNLETSLRFVGDVMDKNHDVIIFISKYLYFKKI